LSCSFVSLWKGQLDIGMVYYKLGNYNSGLKKNEGAGHVAHTGTTLNVRDIYSEETEGARSLRILERVLSIV
jgi:hypothetical protein